MIRSPELLEIRINFHWGLDPFLIFSCFFTAKNRIVLFLFFDLKYLPRSNLLAKYGIIHSFEFNLFKLCLLLLLYYYILYYYILLLLLLLLFTGKGRAEQC